MVKKSIAALLVLVLAGGAAVAAFGDALIVGAMERQALRTLSGDAFREMGDGLHVVVCGAGSPMPDPTRAGPCVAVIAGARVMIVDAGSGAVRRLGPSGIPLGQIEDVFLTHFHSDHIDGLGELLLQRWAGGSRTAPLPVHGPTGVEQVVAGFNQAYTQDFGYRVAHHGPDVIPPGGAGGRAVPFAPPADGDGVVVLEDGALKVTAFAVPHPPIVPAVGYRFDYKGRSVVVSGDTAPSKNLAKFAGGADVLLHEALNPELLAIVTNAAAQAGADNLAQIMRDIHDYHTTPVQAGEIAAAAGVKHLVLYHLVPALPLKWMERMFAEGVADVYGGGVTVGRDGTWIALPANGTAIEEGNRL